VAYECIFSLFPYAMAEERTPFTVVIICPSKCWYLLPLAIFGEGVGGEVNGKLHSLCNGDRG
jgi:hypothetical protein